MKYYLGKVIEVKDRLTYEIRVTIDGVVEDKVAFPFRGEVDEPRIDDFVLLRDIDPIYHSVYLYTKLKEDEFIGYRSNGKMMSITPDYMTMQVYTGENPGEGTVCTVTMDKDGNILIESNRNITVKSSNIVVKGPGTLEVEAAKVEPDPKGGIFWAMSPTVPPPGTPMISGNKVILK